MIVPVVPSKTSISVRKLVEGLLPLALTTPRPAPRWRPDSIDFVDDDDGRAHFLACSKRSTERAGADIRRTFQRTRNRKSEKKGTPAFNRRGFGQEKFWRAGRTDQQQHLWESGPTSCEAIGVLRKSTTSSEVRAWRPQCPATSPKVTWVWAPSEPGPCLPKAHPESPAASLGATQQDRKATGLGSSGKSRPCDGLLLKRRLTLVERRKFDLCSESSFSKILVGSQG